MAGVRVPTWTQADRLRKAREDAGLSVQEMAEAFGYHRNTITGWESGRPIKPGMVRAWADICDVDLDWLENGVIDLSDEGKPIPNCEQWSLFDPWDSPENNVILNTEPAAA